MPFGPEILSRSRAACDVSESVCFAKSGPYFSFAALIATVSSASASASPLRPVFASSPAILRSSSRVCGTLVPSLWIVSSSSMPPETEPATPAARSDAERAPSAFAIPNAAIAVTPARIAVESATAAIAASAYGPPVVPSELTSFFTPSAAPNAC